MRFVQRSSSLLCATLATMISTKTEGWILRRPMLSSFAPMIRTLSTQSVPTEFSVDLPAEVTSDSKVRVEEPSSFSINPVQCIKIAEGSIVARFPGGLTAIRINDDLNGSEISISPPASPFVGVGSSSQQSSLNAMNRSTLTATDYQGKQVLFPNGEKGVVIIHRPPLIFCYSDKEISISDGFVQVMDDTAKVTVSSMYSCVDCFGNVLETLCSTTADTSLKKNIQLTTDRPIFAPIPKVSQIALINHPMLTGITMIDALAPIGRGQNMLLIGSNVDEMRLIARNFISTQVKLAPGGDSTTLCVYASTESNPTAAYQRIQDEGIADQVHFVGMNSGSSDMDEASYAAEAVLVVSTACAIAESYALEKGVHTVVVIDTVDWHKKLWDTTTRTLVDVFGIQSVTQSDRSGSSSSEMRAFYSSMIQRAGQYNAKMGGGSVTLLVLAATPDEDLTKETDDKAVFSLDDFTDYSERIRERLAILVKKGIPLTAATLRKINIPIPTQAESVRQMVLFHIDELISMSDGQIWLDSSLSDQQQPPMDPQRSITRIGIGADTPSRADAPAIRRIAEGVRLELAQAATSSLTGTVTASEATQQQMRRKKALLLAMYQPSGSAIRRLSESCAVLLAAREGYLDASIDRGLVPGSSGGAELIAQLLEHVHNSADNVMKEIDVTLDISEASRGQLTETIAAFFLDEKE
jgi:F0F1-type ATP synthase alpha subunit